MRREMSNADCFKCAYRRGRSAIDPDLIEAAVKREIETLRALVEGLIKASGDCASCGYDCGPRRDNCIIKQAIDYLEGRRGEELSALRQGGMR